MARTTRQVLDELLVLRAVGGDRAAMGVLVKRWQPRLLRHARRLTDDSASARDAVQEAWVAIVRGIRRLDDPARFGAWAYRIVTHKCADRTRRAVRDRELRGSLNHHPAPRDSSEENGEIDRLRAALRRLPPERRALLGLFYVDGLDLGQIAAALGVPRGTVKSRLFHAREELKRVFERTSDERD